MTITATGLGKRFQREWIFRKLDYSFEPGVHAIVGPNGSGKSTLLHVLWGQMPPSEGIVHFTEGGQPIPVDDVFQHLAIAAPYMDLPDQFTVAEMIQFHFRFKQAREGASVEDWLNLLELGHARSLFVRDLSSGMKQRLKLGLAMVSRASLLFLDEPTTNFDAAARTWYHQLLHRLPEDLTILIATNTTEDYPPTAKIIDIRSFKRGY
ncbi:MAG: ABC transporter ATP-binding protein [Cyclobacteriaceae bacterium]|nr:ABC transporter ATP-binding protein [Cyclobacteriaceae bacterium]